MGSMWMNNIILSTISGGLYNYCTYFKDEEMEEQREFAQGHNGQEGVKPSPFSKDSTVFFSLCKFCFPGGSNGKESTCNAGDSGLTPGWGQSPREGNGYSLQYSCLGNFMDSGAWRATEVRRN